MESGHSIPRFSLTTVCFVFAPCVILSIVTTALAFAIMSSGMAQSRPPLTFQIVAYLLVATVLLPAGIVRGLWKGWWNGKAIRKWLIGAAYVLGLLWLVAGIERAVNDGGDWFIYQPVWLCGALLLLAAVIAHRCELTPSAQAGSKG